MYTDNIITTPASNLYKVKKGERRGESKKLFREIGKGVSTYFHASDSSSKDTAKEKPSTKASSIWAEDISF